MILSGNENLDLRSVIPAKNILQAQLIASVKALLVLCM